MLLTAAVPLADHYMQAFAQTVGTFKLFMANDGCTREVEADVLMKKGFMKTLQSSLAT